MKSAQDWVVEYTQKAPSAGLLDRGGSSDLDHFSDAIKELRVMTPEWMQAFEAAFVLLVREGQTAAGIILLIGYFFESLFPSQSTQYCRMQRMMRLRAQVLDGVPKNLEARAYVLRFLTTKGVSIPWKALEATQGYKIMSIRVPMVLVDACLWGGEPEQAALVTRNALRRKVVPLRDVREMKERLRSRADHGLLGQDTLQRYLSELE